MSIVDLLDRPIAFHRSFVSISGSITAALFLSQTVYWSKRTRDNDGWFFKSRDEWSEETGLTRYEQESARKALKKIGVLEEKLDGLPAKLFYRLVESRLEQLLSSLNSLGSCFPANKEAEIPPTSRRNSSQQVGGNPAGIYKEAEITSETTSETRERASSQLSLSDQPPTVQLSSLPSDFSPKDSLSQSIPNAPIQTSSREYQRARFFDWIKSHWSDLCNEYLPFFQNSESLLRWSLKNCIAWSFDNASRAQTFTDPGVRIRKWLDEEDVDRLIRAMEGQEKAARRAAAANPSAPWNSDAESDDAPLLNANDVEGLIGHYRKIFSLFQEFAAEHYGLVFHDNDWLRLETDIRNNPARYADEKNPHFPVMYEFFKVKT